MKFRIDPQIAATGQDFPLGVGKVHHLGRDEGVFETKYYRLDICHVNFKSGDVVRGFMPLTVFKVDILCINTGDTHRGEDQESWDRAFAEGKAMAERLQARLDDARAANLTTEPSEMLDKGIAGEPI